jgi:hypothetical protein
MINLIAAFVSTGIETLLAYGALVGALLAFIARFEPRTPNWFSSLITTALLCVSVWFFSALHHDREAEVAQLKADNNALTRVATAHKIISEQASKSLLDRVQQLSSVEEKVRDYELELERGKISACPPDPAYLSRMRALQFRKAR